MKLTFCLRKPKATKETPINCFVHWDQRQICIATGIAIHPKQWDKKRKRARKGISDEATVNNRLTAIERDVRKAFAELSALGKDLTSEAVKERLKLITGKEKQPERLTIAEAHKRFLEEAHFTHQTAKNHKTALARLKEFCDSSGARYDFDRFDILFWKSFVRYLFDVAELKTDSAWSVLKSLRAFLAWSVEQGLTNVDDFRKVTRRTLPKGEKSAAVYLTMSEIEQISTLDLSDNDKLRKVRDCFLFQLYTGKRYSDLIALKRENVDLQTKEISQVLQKNRKPVRTPLLPEARRIWEMYEGTLPVISNQRYNEYVKDVAKAAKINASIAVVKYSGTKRIEEVKPKYELIGSHTAKRTFATILRQRGVSVEAICAATGNNRRTIESYFVSTDTDAMEEIREAWQQA